MGYTHYFTQTRHLTAAEWTAISVDVRAILANAENLQGVPLADGMGDARTRPEFDADSIAFNGLGDDAHETFSIRRKRIKEWEGGAPGASFCKTARKPYDLAVTACLCYLTTCLDKPAFNATSDGNGSDFLAGLAVARAAVPAKANVVDIPRDVMRADRWTGPWISGDAKPYEVRFCVDGFGYVLRGKASRRFPDHAALGRFLDARKFVSFRRGGQTGFGKYPAYEPNVWNASGCFDAAREARIASAQRRLLAPLFAGREPEGVTHDHPPAFARPGELLRPEAEGTFSYSLADLLRKVNKAA